MYGHQLLRTYEAVHALGLTESRMAFSIRWCEKGEDLLRDYGRRGGAMSRVNPHTVLRIRERLAEAAKLLPTELAVQVREIDAAIEQDLHIADLLGRRTLSIQRP